MVALGVVSVLALLLLACGCTQPQAGTTATPAATQTQASAGMPNPASVYCGQVGGTLEIKTDATGGQYGMCTFANGTSCEEWALYRGEGCNAGTKQMVTFTEADDKTTGDVAQGTKFAVQLKENPTTGYEWNATVSKGLAIISSDFTEGAHAAGMVGVGGTRTWIIQANDLGAQSFNAIYKRSWEATTGNETAYSLTVNVVKA